MTLVAFACYPDRIEAITDTASYTASGSELGRCTKQLAIHHLDALLLVQGDSDFAIRAKVGALEASGQAATFDQLAQAMPAALRDLWPSRGTDTDSVVFLLGYSPATETYLAWMYASEHDFMAERVDEPFVIPSPFTLKPSGLEQGRAAAFLSADQLRMLTGWHDRPALSAPESTQEWTDLALTVRNQRALESFMRVIVAGSVHHTVLRRGRVATREIHTFNDSGEEFLQLIAWTHHPQAQLMECHCGSGERFLDCHLAPFLDQPCGCGREKPFRECCMVPSKAPSLSRA